ncbi:hybrid sensor histidine kinase/response regulator [Thiotrichales bacterium HSG1]|nr:hybrid sensor histidine kinase/response regulator [Thiotrichales bacterium HSG1]
MNDILIVDDAPINLRALSQTLMEVGYKVRPANNGKVALKVAESLLPDLVLLDIMMPDMDGYQVCRCLKSNEKTKNIPVIFISALTDGLDKIKAFEAGGIDYIMKPFHKEEVLARVDTHITLGNVNKKLMLQNQHLITLNKEKNEFLGIAAHDLKNPLSAIKGYSEEIYENFDYMSKAEILEHIGFIQNSSQQMFTIITNLLDVNQIESGKIKLSLKTTDIFPILKDVLNRNIVMACKKNISFKGLENFDLENNTKTYDAYVDINIVIQILDNVVSNAIKYSFINKDVTLGLFHDENMIYFKINNQCNSFTKEDRKKLFIKFSKLSVRPTAKEHSTGLGLFIVKKLVDMLCGKIWCEDNTEKGVTFIITLPKFTK